MQKALAQTVLIGTTTNLSFLQRVLKKNAFLSGETNTHFIHNQMDVHDRKRQTNGAGKTELLLAAYTVWFSLFRHPYPDNLWNQLGHKRWGGKTVVWFNQKPYVIQTGSANSSKNLTWSINQGGQSEISDAILNGHRLSFSMNERIHEYAWHYSESKELLVYGDGLTYSFRPGFSAGDLSPKEELNTTTSPNHLAAPIPGRIVKIDVSPGEKVEKGAPIIILEAMKMENLLTSQTKGIVKEVLVALGQQVKSGQKLVLFEKEPLKTNEIESQIIIKN
jgi:3-methylcrotonyl-CoA carboxylase alpha subunit